MALLISGAVLTGLVHQDERATEFYILGKAGLAEDYPRQSTVDDELSVMMGIVNREPSERSYRVEVWASWHG